MRSRESIDSGFHSLGIGSQRGSLLLPSLAFTGFKVQGKEARSTTIRLAGDAGGRR